MPRKVELYVGGAIYLGWTSATIERSIEAVSGRFRLSVCEKWEKGMRPWVIRPGDRCVLTCNGEAVITGYVDSIAPSVDNSTRGFQVAGRDKTADLVDCSAVVASSEIRGQDAVGIASIICKPFGIAVRAEVPIGAPFPSFAIEPGEAAWDCIDRAAKQRALTVTTDGKGNLVMASIGKKQAEDLVLGGNILSASATFDYSNRFSEYQIKGMSGVVNDEFEAAWDPPKPSIFAKVKDSGVRRYRPLILTGEQQVSDGSAMKRVNLEMARRKGESAKAKIKVQGWTQSNGEIWPLNAMVRVDCPWLYLSNTTLLISSIRYSFDTSSGSITEMELCHPDAFLPDEEKKKKEKETKTDSGGYEEYWED